MVVEVVGSVNVDTIVEVNHLPGRGETVIANHTSRAIGGKGANQAVASAAAAAPTRLWAAVGDDADGQRVRDVLASRGVRIDALTTVDAETGRAMVLVGNDAENLIVVEPGANRFVDTAAAVAMAEALEPDDVLLVQCEIEVATVAAVAAAARGRVVLNAAPALRLPSDLLSAVDVLVVNETELRQLAVTDTADLRAQMRSLDIRTVITTLGADGVAVLDGDQTFHVSPPSVSPVDTTGAGDMFCGTLAAALSTGADLRTAVVDAATAASISTEFVGAQIDPESFARARRGRVATLTDTDRW